MRTNATGRPLLSRLARTIMTVDTTGETAATRRTAGACTPGVNASPDEKAAASTSRRTNDIGAVVLAIEITTQIEIPQRKLKKNVTKSHRLANRRMRPSARNATVYASNRVPTTRRMRRLQKQINRKICLANHVRSALSRLL